MWKISVKNYGNVLKVAVQTFSERRSDCVLQSWAEPSRDTGSGERFFQAWPSVWVYIEDQDLNISFKMEERKKFIWDYLNFS